MSNIVLQFKEAVLSYFKDENEFINFLKESTTAFGGQSPEGWLLYSRRKDRLDFAIKTVIQVKTRIPSPKIASTLKIK